MTRQIEIALQRLTLYLERVRRDLAARGGTRRVRTETRG